MVLVIHEEQLRESDDCFVRSSLPGEERKALLQGFGELGLREVMAREWS